MKHRVLVVDDDEIIRDLVSQFLKFSGHEAETAPNGQKALEMILENKPSLVITDIHMPIMNGFQLLRAVKKIDHNIPVIFITQFQHFRKFFSEKTARADGFLEKPFSLESLDNLVKKLLPKEAQDD